MEKLRVGVVGASGYSGGVAIRLVASHPRLALAFATSDKHAGERVAPRLGAPLLDRALTFVPNGEAEAHADGCDAVILATAADVSMRLAPAFAERGKTVVDVSGAFRLEAAAYPRWYGLEHTAPAWLERAFYGLPEVFGPPPRGATLLSNPGCYPTAALLALAPLVRAGLVEPAGIVIDAKSGVTGAGRRATEEYSFVEIDGDLRAYKLLGHQHTPEIGRGLARLFGAQPASPSAFPVTFTPHLLPIPRGLLATCYARPRPGAGATAARVAECLADAYAKTPFVHAVAPPEVMLKRVVGSNLALVGATANDDVVVTLGAIDNLLKGAAGQAVQNLNLSCGWDETLGLDHLQRIAP
jgi:N-acetyl-gamma-glutamyl-phosphate reductase